MSKYEPMKNKPTRNRAHEKPHDDTKRNKPKRGKSREEHE